jgi:hypothetical protein
MSNDPLDDHAITWRYEAYSGKNGFLIDSCKNDSHYEPNDSTETDLVRLYSCGMNGVQQSCIPCLMVDSQHDWLATLGLRNFNLGVVEEEQIMLRQGETR